MSIILFNDYNQCFLLRKQWTFIKTRFFLEKGDEGFHGDSFNGGISLNPHFF